MTKKLSLNCLSLLKAIITTTGEFENQNGQEVPTARRLNGEESAQRRFFISPVNELFKKGNEERATIVDPIEEKWKEDNKMNEGESKQDYQNRCNAFLNADVELTKGVKEIFGKEHEVDLEKKTWAVIQKYFKEFGDKIGFMPGDDESVELVNKQFETK